MKIVFLDADTTTRDDLDFQPLEAMGEFVTYPHTSPSETAHRAAGAEVILSNKVVIDGAVMDACPELRMIQVCATGTNNVDLEAARERGLVVCNVSGYSTPAVVQHTFALILNLATQVHRYAGEVAEWPQSPFFTRLDHPISELAGKTLGIAGLGTIGRAVADVAEAFGMKVVALAREGSTPDATGKRPRLPAATFFGDSDIVSLHCPLTPETRQMIHAGTLAQMPSHGLLINTGRGDLVDEAALVSALEGGVIGGAGLDVLTAEPPPADHPLIAAAQRLPQLLITPHTAWSSLEARQRLMHGVVRNLEAFVAGAESIPNRVA